MRRGRRTSVKNFVTAAHAEILTNVPVDDEREFEGRLRRIEEADVRKLMKLVTNDDGATAIEYGLLVAMLAVASIGAFTAFGSGLFGMWEYISSTAESVM